MIRKENRLRSDSQEDIQREASANHACFLHIFFKLCITGWCWRHGSLGSLLVQATEFVLHFVYSHVWQILRLDTSENMRCKLSWAFHMCSATNGSAHIQPVLRAASMHTVHRNHYLLMLIAICEDHLPNIKDHCLQSKQFYSSFEQSFKVYMAA